MPWLIMNEVLFIHVPRAGGTSITSHHRVGYKARQGLNPFFKFGLIYYYYRYKLLETANFPLFTWENLIVLCQIVIAIIVYFFSDNRVAPFVMWGTATCTFTMSTIIWTAPITMRNNLLRWLLMMFQSKVLCGFGGETKYMVGTTDKGYMFHITSKRAIKFGYVTKEQVQRCGFAIVRNPWSRAVSMFEYNRRPGESFEHFIKCFYDDFKNIYIGKASCECADIYCHILPAHEYTHMDGAQIVGCVIKQEHLKNLVATQWQDSGVPESVQKALTGIPHANRRRRRRAWQQYYNQNTMNMVYEMYHKDFELFGYSTEISGRSDLSVEIAKQKCRESMLEYQHNPFVGRATTKGTLAKTKSSASGETYVEMSPKGKSATLQQQQLLQEEEQSSQVGSFDENALENGSYSCEAQVVLDGHDFEQDSQAWGDERVLSQEEMRMRREASVFVLANVDFDG